MQSFSEVVLQTENRLFCQWFVVYNTMGLLCVHCTAYGKRELICTSSDGKHYECHVCVMNNCDQTCADSCAIQNYPKPRNPQFCSNFALEKKFASRKDFIYPRTSLRQVRAGAQYVLRSKAFSQNGKDNEIIPIALDQCF